MQSSADILTIVGLLVDVADGDTVYRDVYLRRAREGLGQVLSETAFRQLGTLQERVSGLLDQSRAATFRREWARAAELAAEAEAGRATVAASSAAAGIARRVYEAPAVALDPLSPGLPGAAGSRQRDQNVSAEMVERFGALASMDPPLAKFYESRRVYFSRLALGSPSESGTKGASDYGGMEQLAFEAAQRGDSARLRQLASELSRARPAGAPASSGRAAAWAPYECPVNLDVPFPEKAVAQARALGLVQARTAPLFDVPSLRELIYSHVWQPGAADDAREQEGVVRAQKLVATEDLPPDITEHLKVLVGQFVMHAFVNSGGARYLPLPTSETALIEDFPEGDGAKPELVNALGLGQRNGLARVEIEEALARNGAAVLAERLQLDPLEFRLVCIPYDLYTRFGQSRGWGQCERWTHFDGYQAMRSGRLRALAGGDRRYGGLADLVSINVTDARDNVVSRFSVVRRTRMVARWR